MTDATEIYASNLRDLGVDVLINDLIGQPDWDLRQNPGSVHAAQYARLRAGYLDLPGLDLPAAQQPCLAARRRVPRRPVVKKVGNRSPARPTPTSCKHCTIKDWQPPVSKSAIKIVYEAIQLHIDHGPFMIGGSGDQADARCCPQRLPGDPRSGHPRPVGARQPWQPQSQNNSGWKPACAARMNSLVSQLCQVDIHLTQSVRLGGRPAYQILRVIPCWFFIIRQCSVRQACSARLRTVHP